MKRIIASLPLILLFAGTAHAWTHGRAGAIGNANLNIGDNQPANFVNVFKVAGLTLQNNADLVKLDSDGYPVVRPTADIFLFSPTSGQFWPSVNYTLKGPSTRITPLLFSGSAITNCVATNATVTGCTGVGNTTIAPTGGAWSVTFDLATVFGSIYFPATGGTYAAGSGEIALYRTTDASRYAAGKYFTTEFINLVKGASPNPIRFMPWLMTGTANNSNQTKWEYRKKTTDFSFRSSPYPPGAIVGGGSGAIAGTDTYTASAAPDTPVSYTNGEVAIGVVTNANTIVAATLDVGARGAKPVLDRSGNALVTTGTGASRLVAGISTFVFNSLLDSWIYCTCGITWSMPVEVEAQLADETNSDAWFVIPTLATDDYVSNFGAAIRDNLPARLNAYVEYSNEVWNFAFPQTGLAYNMGYKLGWVLQSNQNLNSWYALRFKQTADLLVTAFGSQSARLRPMMAYQIAQGTSGVTDRFGGAQLVANKQTTKTVTFTTGTPCQVLWTFNGFTTAGWPVSFTSTGNLPTGIVSGQVYYVTNNTNNNDGSTPFNIEASPGSGAIACSGTPTGTATGNYTNPYYASLGGGQDYTVKPNRPIDRAYGYGGAPYAGGENLCTGPDLNCTPTAANAPFFQALVTAWESGDIAGSVAMVDEDMRIGRTGIQNVTASGTTFTTPLAHGFTAASTDVSFQVSGGTAYSGVGTSQLYRVLTTPTASTFTMQGYTNGSPTGAAINAGSAGSGTMTVGINIRKNLVNLASTWNWSTQAVGATYNSDRPVGVSNLLNIQYEGNLEPKGLSAAQCTSLSITGTDCAGSIAAAIVAWKQSVSAKALQIAYFKQFMGTDATQPVTFGLMTNAKAPAQLTLMCSTDYAIVNGCLPTSTVFETYNGFRDFSQQN